MKAFAKPLVATAVFALSPPASTQKVSRKTILPPSEKLSRILALAIQVATLIELLSKLAHHN